MIPRGRFVFALALVAACNRRAPEPEGTAARAPETTSPTPVSSAPETPPQGTPGTTPSSNARAHWLDPGGWTRIASNSPMRLATYRVPRTDGDHDDGELGVFYFGAGQGGDIKANFERWQRQFSMVPQGGTKQSERKAGGFAAHVLQIDRGTFTSGMPGEPPKENPSYGLLGAIVETPAGNYFFKLTGPEKTVKAAEPAFFTMIDSVKLGGS